MESIFFSPFIVPVAAIVAGVVISFFRWPQGRASGRRMGTDSQHAEELAALRHELDTTNERVAELEERLDFTERMLSKQRDRPRLEE